MVNENSITVLGVGNILLTDEGLGVHVVHQLEKEYEFSPAVNIIDGGTMGMELLSYMRGMKNCSWWMLLTVVKSPVQFMSFPIRKQKTTSPGIFRFTKWACRIFCAFVRCKKIPWKMLWL